MDLLLVLDLEIFILTKFFLCRANKDVIVYACDCSNKTLGRVKEVIGAAKILSFEDRFHTFCCDVSTNGFPKWLACHPCQDKLLQKHSKSLSGFFHHLYANEVFYFILLLAP